MKQTIRKISVAVLARAHALVSKALMKFVPQGNPTLESIISSFEVAASQLAELEKRHTASADGHAAEINRLFEAKKKLQDEASRAARIQNRLAELTR